MSAFEVHLPPYLLAIRDYLRREEADVWEWFSSNRVRSEQDEAIRFDLLKRTYRIERESDPALYAAADEAAAALGLDVPITLYQSQGGEGLNASLAFLPGEAHVVLQGPVKARLKPDELVALFAHELSHLTLLRQAGGELLIASQILAALTCDAAADSPHFASDRLFRLYAEIYCDRGSLLAVKDPLVAIRMLVKMTTGLEEADPAAYLRQAEEVFARGKTKAESLTHPEAFIRARALQLWHGQGADAEEAIREMIEGEATLDELDLLGREAATRRVRRLIDEMFRHSWMRSETALAHAKLYFPNYTPRDDAKAAAPSEPATEMADAGFRDAFAYILLDFVTVDRSLEEAPLAAALEIAERWGFKDRLIELSRKELRLRKKQLDDLDRDKASRLERLASEEAPS